MRPTLCFALLYVITDCYADTISKRQTTSCPPNCFQCDGGTCRSCNSGWYGQDCSKSCSSCLGGCGQDTGHCLSCPEGNFGPLCTENCPINCSPNIKGSVTCDVYGYCDNGCKEGYYADTCDLSCGHCRNGSCVQRTGHCIGGCSAAWGGPHCNVTCILHCVKCTDEYSCEQCADGYHGVNCTTADNTPSAYTTLAVSLLGHTSTTGNNVFHSQGRGSSKATVDTAVGISFGMMILILFVFVLVYTNRTKCLALFRANKDEDNPTEPIFVLDDVGSPRMSRSFLKLHEAGLTTSDNKQEEEEF